jgi:hypothetical protein
MSKRYSYVGSLRWAVRTGGELTLLDQVILLGQLLPLGIELQGWRVLDAVGLSRPVDFGLRLPAVPYVRARMPTTPIARAAEEICAEVSPRWLVDHCYRTFAFGVLLGRGLSYDCETLFVAAMLHDIGLTGTSSRGIDDYVASTNVLRRAPCFAVRSAGVARDLAAKHRWPDSCRDASAEAISMHLNARVPRSRVEAHLLNAGSALDVVRLRLNRLTGTSVRDVEAEWPRSDFCDGISDAWKWESGSHSGCRGAFLDRWVSFSDRICQSRPRTSGRSVEE